MAEEWDRFEPPGPRDEPPEPQELPVRCLDCGARGTAELTFDRRGEVDDIRHHCPCGSDAWEEIR